MVKATRLASPRSIVFRADDPEVGTQTGLRGNGQIKLTNAEAGFSLFGGYSTLAAGRYRAIIWLSRGQALSGNGKIDVCAHAGEQIFNEEQFDLIRISTVAPFIQIDFKLFRKTRDVEVRMYCNYGVTVNIEHVEIIALDEDFKLAKVSKPTILSTGQRRRLNILYYSAHEILEFDEIRMFTDAGHRVFSIGAYANPVSVNKFRPSLPQFFHPGDWERFQSEELTEEFASDFDVAIVMHDPEKVGQILAIRPDMPVMYRSIGQSNPTTEAKLLTYSNRIKIVRYSIREAKTPGFLPADAIIYFGKNLGDFSNPWIGGEDIITFHNNFSERRLVSAPSLDDYQWLSSIFPCRLYGRGNERISGSLGFVDPATQLELYRTSALYLYVYTVGPAYTLGFMEALGSGLPIIAPSSNMIAKITDPEIQKEVRFSEAGGRYEIEELLENDPALIYDSIEEARIKIDWLIKNPSYREEVSVRQKTKFATMFDDKKILAQWEDILYTTIDGG